MRTFTTSVWVAVFGALLLTASSGYSDQRISVGPQYDLVTGDADNAFGGYGSYNLDLTGPLGLIVEGSYVQGDFSVPAGSGNYTILSLGAALVFTGQFDIWSPYAGAGGADNFNDFDNVDYGDKLSMFWLAGTRLALGEAATADFSVRYRGLRPDSQNHPEIGEIDMDGWIVRAGLVFEL